jgi:hypothetical protein
MGVLKPDESITMAPRVTAPEKRVSEPTMKEDASQLQARLDAAAAPDHSELAEAVAHLVASKSNPKSRSAMVTIIGSVLALISAAGAGNWAVMSSGDADTQAIVREELQTYGEKVEEKMKAERDMLRLEMQRDREQVHAEVETIKASMQKMQVDIAVIRARAEK